MDEALSKLMEPIHDIYQLPSVEAREFVGEVKVGEVRALALKLVIADDEKRLKEQW